jgi:hypothetical protein
MSKTRMKTHALGTQDKSKTSKQKTFPAGSDYGDMVEWFISNTENYTENAPDPEDGVLCRTSLKYIIKIIEIEA